MVVGAVESNVAEDGAAARPWLALVERCPVVLTNLGATLLEVTHGPAVRPQRVATVVDAAKTAGLACQGHTVEALHPWEAIIDHAKRTECDLLVMASHGRRGVTALLLGSETQKVLTHSTVPVLVVR